MKSTNLLGLYVAKAVRTYLSLMLNEQWSGLKGQSDRVLMHLQWVRSVSGWVGLRHKFVRFQLGLDRIGSSQTFRHSGILGLQVGVGSKASIPI